VKQYELKPMASIEAWASAGVEPRVMGIGPVPASRRVLDITDLYLDGMDVVELNEAFPTSISTGWT
jgi:acetyl-CoA acetyltransferase